MFGVFFPFKIRTIKKYNVTNNKCFGEDVGEKEPSYTAGGNIS
jgi:hypothetical protein